MLAHRNQEIHFIIYKNRANDKSIISEVVIHGFSVILTGDATKKSFINAAEATRLCDRCTRLLKLAHHGAGTLGSTGSDEVLGQYVI